MDPQQSGAELSQLVSLLRQRVGAYLILLFGSYAKGAVRHDSDIDIAFAGETLLSSYEIFLLSQELSALLGREVDLLDWTRISTVMKAQIVATGKVIYCTDELKRQYLFMHALRDYAKLNEERAVVLESIAQRGSCHDR